MNAYFQSKVDECLAKKDIIQQFHQMPIIDLDDLPDEQFFQARDMKLLERGKRSRDENDEICLDLADVIAEIDQTIVKIEQKAIEQPALINVIERPDSECFERSTVIYYVKAASSQDALEVLSKYGYPIFGSNRKYGYGTTGEWLAEEVSVSSVQYDDALECYVVPVCWELDV